MRAALSCSDTDGASAPNFSFNSSTTGTGPFGVLWGVARVGSRVLAMGPNAGVVTSSDGVSWTPWMSADSPVHVSPTLSAAAGSDAQFVLDQRGQGAVVVHAGSLSDGCGNVDVALRAALDCFASLAMTFSRTCDQT